MKQLRRIWPYVRRYRRRYVAGLALTVLAACCGVVAPLFIKEAIDRILRHEPASAILFAALAIAALAAVRSLLIFTGRFTIIAASRRIEFDLRNDLYAHLAKLPSSYYDTHKTGDILSRAINDIEGVRMMIGIGVMAAVGTGLIFVLSVAGMIYLQPKLAIICLAPLVLISVLVALTGQKLHNLNLAIQDQLGSISNRAQENFTGIRVIRAFSQEETEIERFRKECTEYKKRNMNYAHWRGLVFALMTFLMEISLAVTLLAGGKRMFSGDLTEGAFAAFLAYQFMLIWPMIAIGWVIGLIQRGSACMGRINEILDTCPGIDDARAIPGKPIEGRIEIRNLTFGYTPDRPPALRDVSLTIEPGRKVAVVGRTGAGKSTLSQLLMRMYAVPDGKIIIDGRDINSIPLAELRGAIGSVPQDLFLFSDKLRENIAFGSQNGVLDSDILQAAEISRLAADVEKFPDRYDQVIGERGITLSGGQKQRTALARAVIRRPAILILDDALSSVDSHTEQEIVERLREFMKGRTSLVITHRLASVADADLTVVLNEGRIAELGTHAELLRAGGLYSKMWESQRLVEELSEAP